jgi:DNA-binding HxlR family transcriptional regulator
MKKETLALADCPVARALGIIGDWWSMLIVRDAMTGTRRFNEFAVQLGLARNILAGRLKKLVAAGVLEIVPASDGSAYNEYALTPKGQGLFYVLVALRQWSQEWVAQAGEQIPQLLDVRDRKPVGSLELHASDGRRLSPRDVILVDAADELLEAG